MGYLLQAQGKLDQAEPYYREALEKRRRVLGGEHPDTLISINNMGALLQAEGKIDQAEPYYREALEKRRRVLGDEHPHTLASIGSMGALLHAQGKPSEALELLTPAQETARQAFTGSNAIRLGRFLTALGLVRTAIGELEIAETNLKEAYAIINASKAATDRDRDDVLTGLVELYDAWHAAAPDKGFDAKAAECRAKLVE
jgi:non-specific serine/threonine protein kinase/serine/threonine-protein kinase